MFLHSGASLHGHEYSDRPAPAGQHTYKRSPLLRSAFAAPKPRGFSLDGARPPAAVETRRPFSELIPRPPEPVVRFLEPDDKERPATPMTEDAVSVMSGSETSGGSQPSEAATVAPSEASKRRRSRVSSRVARKTTTLALAYPAPRFAGRKRMLQKVAPKLFLQLQEVSLNKRPKPVIDVFPSSRIAGPVIAPRLAKRFPGLFWPKGELGSADVVLMRSEEYETVSEDVDSEDEEGRLEQRQPVAVLSPVKRSGQTEIVFGDGSVWVAQPLPRGSFDFVHTDEHGNTTTARWARRPASKTATAPAGPDAAPKAGRTTPPEPADLRYTFSIINPDSRRHPVMATLTPQFLNIQETYTSVATSSGRCPPCRPCSRSVSVTVAQELRSNGMSARPTMSRSESAASPTGQELDARGVQTPEPDSERTTHPVDEATRLLISVTAVFLALESGWSPYFRPHTHPAPKHNPVADPHVATSPVTDTLCRSSLPRNRRRNGSDGHQAEILMRGSILSSPGSLANPQGRDQSPVRSFVTSPASAAWWETAQPPPSASIQCGSQTPTRTAPARRATTTGAAFMQRARIASAAQQAESSDSEHQPTRSRHRRPRLLSGGSQTEKDRDIALSRHSIGIPSSPALPAAEVASPWWTDNKAVVNGGPTDPHDTPTPASPTRLRPHPHPRRQGEMHAAYYPASPPMVAVQSDESGTRMVAVPAPQVVLEPPPPHGLAPVAVVAEARMAPERGFSGRMKSFGHWFGRLGHGGHPR